MKIVSLFYITDSLNIRERYILIDILSLAIKDTDINNIIHGKAVKFYTTFQVFYFLFRYSNKYDSLAVSIYNVLCIWSYKHFHK